MACPIS